MRTTRRALGAIGLALPATAGRAQAARRLEVVAFQGASNWPVWAGLQQGFFAAEGLDVRLDITPNSVELARNLHGGRYQVALTAVDNVVAYAEGQGEADIPGGTDFFAFMGIDDGVLSLMAAPGIARLEDLRGRGPLAVDALTTGYAFALRQMLRQAGVADAEAPFARVGGHGLRLAALREGRTQATLLTAPLDLMAERDGFRRVARVADALGAYAGVTGNASRGWARDNRETLVAFVRAWARSVAWLVAPENRTPALALFRARMGDSVDAALAESAGDVLLDPSRGLRRGLSIDPAGMRTVLRLRSEQAEPRRDLDDPARYLDLSFRDAALGR